MSVSVAVAMRARSTVSSAWAVEPVTTANERAIPRCVTGMPTAAGCGDGAGDAGHDLRRATPASTQASISSPPRPNTNGSPPFRRTTSLPARARSTRSVVDRLLRIAAAARFLADVDPLGAGGRQVQQGRRDEPVVDDHVGAGQEAGTTDGDQLGVTGTGADQGDVAGHVRAPRDRGGGHGARRQFFAATFADQSGWLRRGRGRHSSGGPASRRTAGKASSRPAPARSTATTLGPLLAELVGERTRSFFASAGEAPPVEIASDQLAAAHDAGCRPVAVRDIVKELTNTRRQRASRAIASRSPGSRARRRRTRTRR